MKVILKNEETQLFLGEAKVWTPLAKEAQDFAFSLHAKAVAEQMNLTRFHVLFYFADLDYKITVLECDLSLPPAAQIAARPA